MLEIPGLEGDLHDATLLEIITEWQGRTTIVMRTAHGNASVIADGVISVTVAHRMPWGRSGSVNEFRLIKVSGGAMRLEIEMQSGDTVVVEANEMRIENV
jgi:hypothetical protein